MATKKTLIGNIKGPKGDPGDKGETGATGAPGTAATINVGTVTTSAYGTMAQVTNSGTETAAVFDFVIPQGKPGEETTRMSALTLDQVTASTETQPIPAVGEVGAVVWGKVIKFFNDIKTAIVNKIAYDDCVANLTSTSSKLPLAANQGKALNDAIVNKIKYKEFSGTSTSAGTIMLNMNTGNAILAIVNRNEDRVEIKLRRDSGTYYAAAYNWDGTLLASYAYNITVVYAVWTDLKPVI